MRKYDYIPYDDRRIRYDKKKYRLLFHGSPDWFDVIDFNELDGYNDFGRGFYLSIENWQSEDIAKRKARGGKGWVYVYLAPKRFLPLEKTKYFREPTVAWLDFIMLNRKCAGCAHPFDVVIGPTADGSIFSLIDTYWDLGGLSVPLSTKQQIVKQLKPNYYPQQVCICNPNTLSQLQRVDTYFV